MQSSHGLFGEVNQDVGKMSLQIGSIIAGAGPALLTLLSDLNPLLVTFGDLLTRGADELEGFATNASGVESFVGYVQAELPVVASLLGETILLISHLAQGTAPFGGVLLHDIDMFVGALDEIPVGAWRDMIPIAISLYVAMKSYQAVTAVVNGVTGALKAMKAPFQQSAEAAAASAAQTKAAEAQRTAAVQVSAAKVAEAKLSEVQSQQKAGQAAAEWGAVYETVSAEVVTAAETEAAALRLVADTAVTTAAKAEAAAADTAAAAATAGAEASAGWAAMLGPIGAIIVGGGLLATTFLHSGDGAQKTAEEVNTLTQALEADSGAIGANTQASIINQLQKAGALEAARQLGLNLHDVTLAAEGDADATDRINAAYQLFNSQVKTQNGLLTTGTVGQKAHAQAVLQGGGVLSQQQTEWDTLNGSIDGTNKTLNTAVQKQRDAAAAAKATTAATAAQAQATADQNAAFATAATVYATTPTAYKTAQQAAEQNTAQTQAQTLAFQLENNAAGLLNQALQTMSGQNLSVAQAQTSFQQSTNTTTATLKANKDAITGTSDAALASQQAIQGSVSSARALASVVAQQTNSNKDAAASYAASKAALEKQLTAQKLLTPAVQAYIDQLYDVKDINSYLAKHPTQIDLDTAVLGKAEALAAYLKKVFAAPITQQVYLSEVTKKATSLPGNRRCRRVHQRAR